MAPFVAVLLQRYGLRRTVAMALGLVILGCLLSVRMTAVWQLWLTWGAPTGLGTGTGTGMTALVLGATVANRWFTAWRGLMLGMLTAVNATASSLSCPSPPGLPRTKAGALPWCLASSHAPWVAC